MAWAWELVQQEKVDFLQVSFLIVGHTNFSPDLLFSKIAMTYNQWRIYNRRAQRHHFWVCWCHSGWRVNSAWLEKCTWKVLKVSWNSQSAQFYLYQELGDTGSLCQGSYSVLYWIIPQCIHSCHSWQECPWKCHSKCDTKLCQFRQDQKSLWVQNDPLAANVQRLHSYWTLSSILVEPDSISTIP